jgi:hypothetical protein
MNIKQLKEYLELVGVPDDYEVKIVVSGRTLPGTPTIPVDKIVKGFDWDSGKLLLFPSDKLVKVESKKRKK